MCLWSWCSTPLYFWGSLQALPQLPALRAKQAPAPCAEIRPGRLRASLQQCRLMKMTAEEKRTVMRHFKRVTRACSKVRKHWGALPCFSSWGNSNDFSNNCRSSYPSTGTFWFKTTCNMEVTLGKTWTLVSSPCKKAEGEDHSAGAGWTRRCMSPGWAAHPWAKDPV